MAFGGVQVTQDVRQTDLTHYILYGVIPAKVQGVDKVLYISQCVRLPNTL